MSIYCCGIYLKNPKVSRTSGRVCLFVNHVCDMGFTSSGSCGWLWRNRVWSDRKCNVRQTNVRHNGRRSHLRFCLKTGCYSQRSITVLSFIWKCTNNIFLTYSCLPILHIESSEERKGNTEIPVSLRMKVPIFHQGKLFSSLKSNVYSQFMILNTLPH